MYIDLVLCMGIIRRISNYIYWILFICKGPTSFIESINQSGPLMKKLTNV